MNIALIVAGGKGKRFNNEFPKQFVKLKNYKIFEKVVTIFDNCELIDYIIITGNRNYKNLYLELINKSGFKKVLFVVNEGDTRQLSVFNSLLFFFSNILFLLNYESIHNINHDININLSSRLKLNFNLKKEILESSIYKFELSRLKWIEKKINSITGIYFNKFVFDRLKYMFVKKTNNLKIDLNLKSNFKSINKNKFSQISYNFSIFKNIKMFLKDFKIIIHDVARPFVNSDLIKRVISPLEQNEFFCTIPIVKVKDSIIKVNSKNELFFNERVKSAGKKDTSLIQYLNREFIYRIQTPQGFSFINLLLAHIKAFCNNKVNFSDDGSLYLKFFKNSLLIPVKGEELNFKITYQIDKILAESIIESSFKD